MKKVKVTVTADDLREGRYASSQDCPIARALKRAFPGQNISVGSTMFFVPHRMIDFNDISPRLQLESDRIQRHTARPFWFNVSV